ncbi:phage tail protein I [Rhodoblastus sp.]|uniref:phage tail protein I n=1 Tax=Rhodoblastus sp. TaxID=1962975 RepID=UPI003F9859B2
MTATPGDDLLPNNATALERAISGAGARMLDVDVAAIRRERSPQNCDAQFLPLLGWERSVHYWSPTDQAANRARVQTAFNDHLNYGSPVALEAEIALDTGLNIEIEEFWQAGLAWPYFAVNVVANPGDPAPDLAGAWSSALARKNVRDMPVLREKLLQPPALVSVAAAAHVGLFVSVLPAVKPPPAYLAAAISRKIVSISIQPFS